MLIRALNEQKTVTLRRYNESTGQSAKAVYQASLAKGNYHMEVGESDIADIRIIVTNKSHTKIPKVVEGNFGEVICAIMPENLARVNDCLANGQEGYRTFELVFKSEDAESAYSRVYAVPEVYGRRIDFNK